MLLHAATVTGSHVFTYLLIDFLLKKKNHILSHFHYIYDSGVVIYNSYSSICSPLCQTHFVKCKVGSVKERKKSRIYKLQSLHNLDSPLPLYSGDRINGKQSQTKHFRGNLASLRGFILLQYTLDRIAFSFFIKPLTVLTGLS